MKIRVWGARGSIPAPLKPREVEEKICQAIFQMPKVDTTDMAAVQAYVQTLSPLQRGTAGGNTACVQIQSGEEIFIIDAGSGLRELGLTLMQGPCGRGAGVIHLFLSHPHWDHIQGFPFFTPAFIPGNQINIYAIHDIETALIDQQRELNFPVPLSYMQATIHFSHLTEGQQRSIGPLSVNTLRNAHPGTSYSYRFEDDHSVFVYANDAEYQRLDDDSVQAHLNFFNRADALIFDAQYTLKEAWQKIDWGHSSAMIGVDLARAAQVKRLILFHHDPTYSDQMLQTIQQKADAYQGEDPSLPLCEIMIGYEGLTLDLTPTGTVAAHVLATGQPVLKPTSVFDERGLSQLAQKWAELIGQATQMNAILDLSNVETLTTASLKSLIALGHGQGNRQLVLANPSDSVQRVIELNDYSNIFAIYPSVEAASEALRARDALNLPGNIIKDRYKIVRTVGEGRLGTILEAIDLKHNESVALKVLSPTFSTQTISRFLHHTKPIKKLEHPHILEIFEVDEVEGSFAFVVEALLTAQTLQDMLASQAQVISFNRAMEIAYDLVSALEYAHNRGALHSDLKPRNIFLTSEGIKICDFGLGRLEEGHNLLKAPLIFLTEAYLAPEQILGEAIDIRTDLYALGVVLYELFTGKLPYDFDDPTLTLEAHISFEAYPRPPHDLNSQISVALSHLILKLLHKEPTQRYENAQQVRRILQNLSMDTDNTVHQARWPLVQREQPLNLLRSCWEAAQTTGTGQLVFVTGDRGLGKSTLARHIAAWQNTSVVVFAQGRSRLDIPDYYLFSKIFEQYITQVGLGMFDNFTDKAKSWFGDIAQIAPQLRAQWSHLPISASSSALSPLAQAQLTQSVINFIQAATAETPWLLVLDDLHRADAPSLQLLTALAQHLPDLRLLIVGLYEGDDWPDMHPLKQLLTVTQQVDGVQHITLDRLNKIGTERLLHNLWQQTVPEAFIEAIHRHTDGNPLYSLELARSLVDDGIITREDGVWQFGDLETFRSENVRDAIWRRTRHLDPDAQSILRRAAVIGEMFDMATLQATADLTEDEILTRLDMALERHLIQESFEGRGQFRFSHPEVQQILYLDLNTSRLRLLHQQTAEFLVEQPQNERSTALVAYHFAAAASFEAAIDYALQTADQASEVLKLDTALRWYDQALEWLKLFDTVPNRTDPKSTREAIYQRACRGKALILSEQSRLKSLPHNLDQDRGRTNQG